MPAIPIVTTAVGAYSTLKGQSDAKKAANQAAQAAQQAQINIPQVAQLATDQALKNLALSRQVEQQYAPENAALRSQSIYSLLNNLGANPTAGLQDQLAANFAAGGAGTYGGSIADQLAQAAGGGTVAAGTADSALLNDAIARAQSDLALGGAVPLDVRNLVARTAAARTAGATGNLGLGRDVNARDLGLTSLQLAQQRLQNAQGLGQAQLGANQFNTNLAFNAALQNAQMQQALNQYNTSQRNAALQFDAAQRQQANQFGAGNQLNIAQILSQLGNSDFNQRLAAAQFGQQLQAPVVGLDPSAIANLAVGNSNLQANAAQNAASIAASRAQGSSQLGGQLLGLGLNGLSGIYNAPGTSSIGSTLPSVSSLPSFSTPAYVPQTNYGLQSISQLPSFTSQYTAPSSIYLGIPRS